MNQKQKELLERVEHHLRFGQLIHERWDFAHLNAGTRSSLAPVPGCGSAGCAIGEFPGVFPDDWEFRRGVQLYLPALKRDNPPEIRDEIGDAAEYFGLTRYEIEHLFFPNQQMPDVCGGQELHKTATKEQVADGIAAFLERKEVTE